MVQRLNEHEIKLPVAVLVYRALKSTNRGEDDEELIMVAVIMTLMKW